ncbi:MAG: CheR family methyltransferase [Hyphomicrobium sp.]
MTTVRTYGSARRQAPAASADGVDPVLAFEQSLDRHFSVAQFDLIRSIARRYAGIVIADHKRSMVLRRIRRRLKALSLPSVDAYCALLQGPSGGRELQPLINALTTNKTSFFRESHHFDHLRDVALPELLDAKRRAGSRRLRIWSAGCSTGEEPWSIAMTVLGAIPQPSEWDIQVIATDIDTDVLSTAKRGRYAKVDLLSAPSALRASYFEKCADDKDAFQASHALHRIMNFQSLNLHDTWPIRGPIDAIFCRNVVIYFDKSSQRILFDRFAGVLAENSFLYCGHSESLHSISKRFEAVGRSIYRRVS